MNQPRPPAILLLSCVILLDACVLGLPLDVTGFMTGSTASPRPSLDVAPTPYSTSVPDIPHSPTGNGVYLAGLGGFPVDIVAELADVVGAKFDIDVQVLPPSPLDWSAFDAMRDQYVAEDLVDALQVIYPKVVEDKEGSAVIGLLIEDVYIRDRPDWNWAFGVRDEGFAVVSSARMGSLDNPIAPIVASRLRKMVLRDVGVLYFGLPLNDDPSSVLYQDVLSVDDLDRMSEELCGSSCPQRASTGRSAVAEPSNPVHRRQAA
jgi:predicted Zn-dependent protease